MSNAAAWSVPSSWAIAVAIAGVCSMWVTVATMTQSICRASMPDRSSAVRDAATDIICTVSSGVAQRRCLMPERCWIHSSLESIASTTSAFGIPRRAVGADAEDRGVRGALGGIDGASMASLGVEADQRLAREPGRRRATSHSTIWPPWAAVTLVRSRGWRPRRSSCRG